MVLRDVIVALVVLLLVLAVLGWRRGRRLHALFDSVWDLRPGAFAAYRPGRIEEVPLADRSLTQKDGKVEVTVAVLSARESRALFGTDLARSGIQPVWLVVENRDAVPYWLLTAGLDAGYFSAREAAWVRHTRFARSANRQMDEFFDQIQFRNPVAPGTTGKGFVFSNLDEHTESLSVDLVAPRQGSVKTFTFFVPVPKTDVSRVDLERMYAKEAIVRLRTEAELRAAVEQLPGFTTRTRPRSTRSSSPA